jgi:hypothetical protein
MICNIITYFNVQHTVRKYITPNLLIGIAISLINVRSHDVMTL